MPNWRVKAFLCIAGGLFLYNAAAPAHGEEKSWDFDSISPKENLVATDPVAPQQVYDVLLKMLDRWNAHDLDGYMDCFWKSPKLVFLVDAEVHIGWQELEESYKRGFPNAADMGVITPIRIQVRMINENLAFALTRWTVTFPRAVHPVSGIDTNYLQKFSDGWKVISLHTSTTSTSEL